jgi:adenylate cyclase
MGKDEEGTLERLKALRRELADPKIKEHHGRVVKTTGDGLLIESSGCDMATRPIADLGSGADCDRAVVARDLGDYLARSRLISVGLATVAKALALPLGVVKRATILLSSTNSSTGNREQPFQRDGR